MKSCWIIRLLRQGGTLQSEQATFFLGPENEIQRVLANGNVNAETTGQENGQMRARADDAELLLTAKKNLLRTAALTGHVHVERIAAQPMQGDGRTRGAGFPGPKPAPESSCSEGVRLAQHAAATNLSAPNASPSASSSQDLDITAPIIDSSSPDGRRLDRAQTSGAAQITISPAPES